MRRRLVLLALVGPAASSGCGASDTAAGPGTGVSAPNVDPPPGGAAQFTVSPIDLLSDSIGSIVPLGNLSPPGHTLPSDHAGIYAVDIDHFNPVPDTTVRPVYAPATGTVWFMLQPVGTDWKVTFRVTNSFNYYVDHLWPVGTLHVGQIVHAGDLIGTTGPGQTLDLGAWDSDTTLPGFINPARYAIETIHAVSPWKYFVEPLRSEIYARLRRASTAPDKDARIDFDVPGHLVGGWFEQSVPDTASYSPTGWPRTLAFVYDYYDPSLVRIAIGGTVDAPGVWGITADAPRPETVTVASGLVAYRLMYLESTNEQWGLMLVQMIDDHTIKVEVFDGNAVAGAFDADAHVYVR